MGNAEASTCDDSNRHGPRYLGADVFTGAKGYRSQAIDWAYSYANKQALEATDVVNEYQWLTTEDESVCPACGPLRGERRKAGQQYTSGLTPAFAHIEYRCKRCNHLLFKGNLQLLVSKQHDPNATYIEPKCPRSGLEAELIGG